VAVAVVAVVASDFLGSPWAMSLYLSTSIQNERFWHRSMGRAQREREERESLGGGESP